MTGLIKFQDVYRDAIQSLFGTNPSADEIIAAYQHVDLTGISSIQTLGGTFLDIFAEKRRDEWEEVRKIATHFKEKGVKQTALIRGDMLFGYEPQPFDVVLATVVEFAKLGVNEFQNFHGMNDINVMKSVAEAVRLIHEDRDTIRDKYGIDIGDEEYDISVRGTICIEDNDNVTLEKCLAFAEELVATGHKGFYLKSASGRLDAEFTSKLTAALLDKYPDHDIGIHGPFDLRGSPHLLYGSH